MAPLSPIARWSAILIAAFAFVALIGQWIYQMERTGEDGLTALWTIARFFTNLTTLLVAITFARIARAGAPWIAALVLADLIVGIVYHLLLTANYHPTGIGWWSDLAVHTVLPIVLLVWWLVYAPKRALVWADLPTFALWPVVYVAYALARAEADGIYPYNFMNVVERGLGPVVTTLGAMLGAALIGGAVMIALGRSRSR